MKSAPATFVSCEVGVLRIFCSAGKRVKTMIHVKKRPTATQTPISRTGRMAETASAAKPTSVAKIEAVQATNLLLEREDLVRVDAGDPPGGRRSGSGGRRGWRWP